MAFGRLVRRLISFLSPKEHEKDEPVEHLHIHRVSLQAKQGVHAGRQASGMDSSDKGKKALKFSNSFSGHVRSAYSYVRGNRKAKAALVVLAATILFYRYVIPFYVVVIFIAAASVSKLIQDWIPFVVGFDLVLFVTVLAGAAYDWRAALIVGPVASIIGSCIRRVTSQQFDTLIFPAIGYGVIAAIIPFIPYTNIYYLGLACTAVYVLIMNLVFAYFRPDLFNHITFTATAILFNYWLFRNFAEPIMAVIT